MKYIEFGPWLQKQLGTKVQKISVNAGFTVIALLAITGVAASDAAINNVKNCLFNLISFSPFHVKKFLIYPES